MFKALKLKLTLVGCGIMLCQGVYGLQRVHTKVSALVRGISQRFTHSVSDAWVVPMTKSAADALKLSSTYRNSSLTDYSHELATMVLKAGTFDSDNHLARTLASTARWPRGYVLHREAPTAEKATIKEDILLEIPRTWDEEQVKHRQLPSYRSNYDNLRFGSSESIRSAACVRTSNASWTQFCRASEPLFDRISNDLHHLPDTEQGTHFKNNLALFFASRIPWLVRKGSPNERILQKNSSVVASPNITPQCLVRSVYNHQYDAHGEAINALDKLKNQAFMVNPTKPASTYHLAQNTQKQLETEQSNLCRQKHALIQALDNDPELTIAWGDPVKKPSWIQSLAFKALHSQR